MYSLLLRNVSTASEAATAKVAYNFKPLHWTFQITDRRREVSFFEKVLGMKMLRHTESKGELGPGSRGSRTIMGYGSGWFALELLFTEDATELEMGNDFLGMTIASKNAIARAKALNWPIDQIEDKLFMVQSPQGLPFYLINEPTPTDCDPIKEICLRASFLTHTENYWRITFGVHVSTEGTDQARIFFSDGSCKVRFVGGLGQELQRKPGHGYLTVSIPKTQLELLEYRCLENNRRLTTRHSIIKPGLSIGCHALIFHDPDDHEVIFVEDEGYAESIAVQPSARNAFDLALQRDRLQRREAAEVPCPC